MLHVKILFVFNDSYLESTFDVVHVRTSSGRRRKDSAVGILIADSVN
jgi:hypothetical protein